jgi:hypothetical protein
LTQSALTIDRRAMIREVSNRLGRRRLIWAGLRADDVEPLVDLAQTEATFSIVGAYRDRQSIESLAHEDLTGVRVDLDAWDIDDHLDTAATREFRRSMLAALAEASAMVAYRPSRFLSAIWFARQDRCLNLSLFGAHQAAFEHKPWVESAVASLGLPCIPWIYVADEEQYRARALLHESAIMLRRSRGSGGTGITRIETESALADHWPEDPEAFVSVASFIADALPVNVGATVWADAVTIHRPSVQLIGIPGCVTRPFGYCGNDFGAAVALPSSVIDEIEQSTIVIGNWMRSHGYRGTFGVDFLVHDGRPLFTEVNPRFQGSTSAASRLDIEEGMPCLVLEHVAAMLDCPAPPNRPLREQVASSPPWSHLVVHWTGTESRRIDPSGLITAVARAHSARADVMCRPDLLVNPGGVVVRLSAGDAMTDDGYSLRPPWRSALDEWMQTQRGPGRRGKEEVNAVSS